MNNELERSKFKQTKKEEIIEIENNIDLLLKLYDQADRDDNLVNKNRALDALNAELEKLQELVSPVIKISLRKH